MLHVELAIMPVHKILSHVVSDTDIPPYREAKLNSTPNLKRNMTHWVSVVHKCIDISMAKLACLV